jgi:hypothetical protein
VTVEYPDLADYIAVASAVTGIEPGVVLASMKANLSHLARSRLAGGLASCIDALIEAAPSSVGLRPFR